MLGEQNTLERIGLLKKHSKCLLKTEQYNNSEIGHMTKSGNELVLSAKEIHVARRSFSIYPTNISLSEGENLSQAVWVNSACSAVHRNSSAQLFGKFSQKQSLLRMRLGVI